MNARRLRDRLAARESETILVEADREACDAITAGVQESPIHAGERRGADAAPPAAFATGPEAILASRTACEYIHPLAGGPSSPRDI